jgi:hypothetical protein
LIYINSTNHPLQKAIIDLAVQHIEALKSKCVFWFGWIAVLLPTTVSHRFFSGHARLDSCDSGGSFRVVAGLAAAFRLSVVSCSAVLDGVLPAVLRKIC